MNTVDTDVAKSVSKSQTDAVETTDRVTNLESRMDTVVADMAKSQIEVTKAIYDKAKSQTEAIETTDRFTKQESHMDTVDAEMAKCHIQASDTIDRMTSLESRLDTMELNKGDVMEAIHDANISIGVVQAKLGKVIVRMFDLWVNKGFLWFLYDH